jgi:hypothetical protein
VLRVQLTITPADVAHSQVAQPWGRLAQKQRRQDGYPNAALESQACAAVDSREADHVDQVRIATNPQGSPALLREACLLKGRREDPPSEPPELSRRHRHHRIQRPMKRRWASP